MIPMTKKENLSEMENLVAIKIKKKVEIINFFFNNYKKFVL